MFSPAGFQKSYLRGNLAPAKVNQLTTIKANLTCLEPERVGPEFIKFLGVSSDPQSKCQQLSAECQASLDQYFAKLEDELSDFGDIYASTDEEDGPELTNGLMEMASGTLVLD